MPAPPPARWNCALAAGAIDAKQAADRLESLLYAWRGDRQERALRERLAELKAGIGSWRAALALLRDSETLFPDDKAAIHAELTEMFAALLRGDTADSLAPLELVSVVEENADLLPGGPDGEALQAKLADRLAALDLPKRAGPVLEKLMQAATSGVARAGFGARLAALRLREGDAAGALAALDASVAADLPAELAERRTLLVAAANARRGDSAGALAALGTLDSAAADEARATILERANDWPAAQRALTAYAAKTVPAEGKLDDAQRRTLLRLATATARAGDNAALTELRRREGARMGSGPLADMFRLLTADQISSVADLKRSGQETALARELPGQLKAAAGVRAADPLKPGASGLKNPLACRPPFPHVPRPWPKGTDAARARSTGCLLVGTGYAMDALSPLGMVSDAPNEIEQKDYFVEKDGVKFAGTHLLLDLWGAANLTDPELIDRALRDAAEAADATILHSHFHHFGPDGGVSGVVVLAESHISIHTWPERDFAAVDIFMCGACNPYHSVPVLKEVFAPKSILLSEQRRGLIA